MSLINRMLGDLAARQAPGAETLAGVRLDDPLAAVPASLSPRRVLAVLAVAILLSLLAFWLLRPPPIPVPVVRGLSAADTAAELAPAAAGAAEVVAPSAPSEPPAALAVAGRLQLSASLSRIPELDEPAEPEEELAPPASAPRAARREPPPRPTAPSPPAAAIQPATPAAAVIAAPATPDKAAARKALAEGAPAAALLALGEPQPGWDAETEALQAASLQRLSRHDEAAAAYGRLLDSGRGEPGHWVGLAISLEARQDLAAAQAAYRRALEFPTLAPALRRYAESRLGAESPR